MTTKTITIKASSATTIVACFANAYEDRNSVELRKALTQDWEDRGFESQEDCLGDDFGGLCEEDTLVDFEVDGKWHRGVLSGGGNAAVIEYIEHSPRLDPRYVDSSADDVRMVAHYQDLDMGGWAGGVTEADKEAFRAAIVCELMYGLTLDDQGEINVADIEIEEVDH